MYASLFASEQARLMLRKVRFSRQIDTNAGNSFLKKPEELPPFLFERPEEPSGLSM
jgi:hypothetical protein